MYCFDQSTFHDNGLYPALPTAAPDGLACVKGILIVPDVSRQPGAKCRHASTQCRELLPLKIKVPELRYLSPASPFPRFGMFATDVGKLFGL